MIIHIKSPRTQDLWRSPHIDKPLDGPGEPMLKNGSEEYFLIVLEQFEQRTFLSEPYFCFLAVGSNGKVGIYELRQRDSLNLEEYEHERVQEHHR